MEAPPEAKPQAPLLRQAIATFQSRLQAEQNVKQIQAETDSVKTKVAAVNSELEVLAQQRQRLEQDVVGLESQQRARLEALRQELEARMARELDAARQAMRGQYEKDVTRRIQQFEARQQETIGQALEQEIDAQERELAQLSQELDVQTQELNAHLSRLEISPDVSRTLGRSTAEALTKRRADLVARRRKIIAERDARVAALRVEFTEQLKRNYELDQRRRLTLNEASIRQAMAELLTNTRRDQAGQIDHARKMFSDVRNRYGELAQVQASLNARTEALSKELSAAQQRVVSLQTEQDTVIARLEGSFQQPNAVASETFAWFDEVTGHLPQELAGEFERLKVRVVVSAEQMQRMEERSRVLRERQQALQLAHEMEARQQAALLKQQREQEAKARKADELLAKANQWAERQRYDEALRLIAQAQELNPPQVSRVTIAREQIVSAKERADHQVRTDQLEQLFAKAMQVFQQGKYEESIGLFEQVIAQEAALDPSSVRLVDSTNP